MTPSPLQEKNAASHGALIHSTQCAGITAKYTPFDSWSTSPKTKLELKKTGVP